MDCELNRATVANRPTFQTLQQHSQNGNKIRGTEENDKTPAKIKRQKPEN